MSKRPDPYADSQAVTGYEAQLYHPPMHIAEIHPILKEPADTDRLRKALNMPTESKTPAKPKPKAKSTRRPAGGKQTTSHKKAAESQKASVIPSPPAKLKGGAAKLAWIQQHLTTNVAKTGHNDHHNYDYFQEHGVLDLLKPYLEKVGAGYILDFQEVDAQGNHTRGMLAITVFDMNLSRSDIDWGVTERYPGEATDSQDKGSNKLMTTAVKYALQKCFGIPTEALEDTDANSNGGAPASTAAASKPKPIAAKKAAALRATAAQAVDDQKLDAKAVTAFLTSEFRKSKITELTASEAEKFEGWLTEQVG